ncbi:hypothetical protein [Bdellovibrio sp. HCB337]|uniref:hypothetical protein n=1 Tax=Bdellovibrio sp. HCB337 TaxID=3394358 RepID=UPI0039A5B272
MTSNLRSVSVLFVVAALAACSHKPTPAPETRKVASQPRLPGNEPYTALEDFVATLDLTAPGTELSLSSGGTSVYAVVKRGGKPLGAVLPDNAATKLSGEVLSFRLAQVFGIADIYQSGFYMLLEGKNLQAFQAIIPTTPLVGAKYANKELNRKAVLERIQKNPQGIDAIFKDWALKPSDYDAMVSPAANTLNTKHALKGSSIPFAQFLSCKGPQPSAAVAVSFNGGTSDELTAARELSTIFVVDALVQQWDRFSGGNLQTITVDGKTHFAAFDNGGTWGGPKWTEKYTQIVSRFDANVVQKVQDMNQFLNEGGQSFLGFTTEEELIQALGIDKIRGSFPRFKTALKTMAEHMKKNQGCTFP